MKKIIHLFITIIIIFYVLTTFALAQNEVTKLPLLYKVNGQENIKTQKSIVYKKIGKTSLKMDIYSPTKIKAKLPTIIFISGAGDTKDWQIFKDYGAVTAAQGIIAIHFNKRFANSGDLKKAREDTQSLLKFVQKNADKYGIDNKRIGIWVFSGGGNFADLGMQKNQSFIKFIVSYYGIDELRVSKKIKKIGDKLPPIMLVRAGKDSLKLNNAITNVLMLAISNNLKINFINYAEGSHAFDIFNDTTETRKIIEQTYCFVLENFKNS